MPDDDTPYGTATTAADALLPADVRGHVRFRDTWWNVDEALSTFTRARVAFGLEPHTLIMAMTGKVPVVHARPLRHGRKGWMFRDLGLGDNLFDIDSVPAETISRRVLALHHDAPAARAAAEAALRELHRLQARTLDVVQQTLD